MISNKCYRLAIMLCGLFSFSENCHADSRSSVQNRLAEMGAQVQSAMNGDTSGVFTIRLKAGTIFVPNDFILHSAQTKGRFLQLEQVSPDLIDLYLADIWIWNEDEIVSDLLDQATVSKGHPVVSLLDQQCRVEAEVRQIDIEIPNSPFRHQQVYLSIGGQVVAYSPILAPLIMDIMKVFAKINCGPKIESNKSGR